MSDCFRFSNLDTTEENYILDKFVSKMEEYNHFYRCFFEKGDDGVFKVSVYVNNPWGPLYTSAKNLNLEFLCDYTENIMTQQLDKLKATIVTQKNNVPDNFL